MSLKSTLLAACAAAFLTPLAALAGDAIMVKDPYARASTPTSVSGAAFMTLMNHGAEDDRLISARSDIAERVELHTHIEDTNGVMRMVEVKDGFAVPAGGMYALERGGAHVMFMGLKQPLVQGETVPLTLVFEKAGEVTLDVPVDLTRKPGAGAHNHNHGG